MIPDAALAPQANKAAAAQTSMAEITVALANQPIDSQERAEWAAQVIHELAEQRAGMVAERDSVAKVMRQLANKVSRWWKPPIDTCDQAIAGLKQGVKTYRDREAAAQTAALAAVVDMAPEEARAEVARAVVASAPVPAGLSERETWAAEIVDRSKIPEDYWIFDQARADREVRAMKHNFSVPGLRAVRDTIMVRK